MRVLYSLSSIVAAVIIFTFTAPAFASKTDSRIELSARQTYVFKTYLQADDIKIQSKDGAVILTGIVSEESHKTLAQETVASLPSVKSIDNRLEVRGAPPTANSDAWLRDKVKITLLFHSSVRASKTDVDVKDGVVILHGDATSQAQKQLATEYAMDVEGVREVKNEMAVIIPPEKSRTVGEKIDDASITAQVKMTLLYHRSTSALNTSVTTKRAVVTLTGQADNRAEIDLASKLTLDVNGVQSVKNAMTVK